MFELHKVIETLHIGMRHMSMHVHRIRTSTPAGAAPAMDSSLCSQLHEHNLYRIRTMSMNALQRRIYTIQRCDKLQSFIEVLINKHTSVPWALMAKS